MNLRTKAAALTLAAAVAIIPAAAQHDGADRQHAHQAGSAHERQFGQRMLDRAAVALSLTDAQKTAAQQIMADAKAQAEPIRAQLKQNRQDMQTAVKANNTGSISQLAARQGQLAGQLAEIHAKAMASFYSQLTPEQKTKADQLKHGWQARGAGRWHASREL